MKASQPHFIVGIGGSAGSLSAFKALLDALASDTGMAFVIVSHILPTATSQLTELLARRTKMAVKVASAAMPILANHVYVSPPNVDLLIEDGAFKVVSPRTRRNGEIDCFLISLAEAMGDRAIGVILSGFLADGTEGCKQIKGLGGKNFAQDKSAEVSGMSLSVQASGCVDFILPPDKIAAELNRIGKRRVFRAKDG